MAVVKVIGMRGQIQVVFFDLGGVVVNFKNGFARLSSALGVSRNAIEQAYHRHVGPAAQGSIDTAELWRRIRQDLDLLDDGVIADYEAFWTDSFAPISETHALLRELSVSYTLGVISNTERGMFEEVSRKGYVPDVPFAIVIASCDVGCVKPDKQIYRIAQNRAGVQSSEILFIDDREENIEAARALGWHGIVFNDGNPRDSVQEIRATLARFS